MKAAQASGLGGRENDVPKMGKKKTIRWRLQVSEPHSKSVLEGWHHLLFIAFTN